MSLASFVYKWGRNIIQSFLDIFHLPHRFQLTTSYISVEVLQTSISIHVNVVTYGPKH